MKTVLVGLGQQSRRRSGAIAVLLALLTGTCVLSWTRLSLFSIRWPFGESLDRIYTEADPHVIWEKITPSSKLVWTACYEDKQCAKFSVPLDYNYPDGQQAAIALLKRPSKFPSNHSSYRGPVLFNPGGPGGSGVESVHRKGKELQVIIGDEYDIVGFDPRGMGFSDPPIVLFSDAAEGAAWDLRHEADPPLSDPFDGFTRDVARWNVYGHLAHNRLGQIGEYVSTALVARDMLRITEAHGYEKLRFWGMSYGSVLGITFAAMFPDKVERLIVDGVLDVYDYYAGKWSNALRDADAGLSMFYQACVEAGPRTCALYASNAGMVAARVDAIFASLRKQPIPIVDRRDLTTSGPPMYGEVTYTATRNLLFQYLYSPYGKRGIQATDLARALVAVEKSDGRPLWNILSTLRPPDFRCNCSRDEDRERRIARLKSAWAKLLAVACSDGDVVDDDLEELREHHKGMMNMSTFAELASVRNRCAGWKIRAKERFRGPFVGNTSHPILLIGNTADPVTSLWNARKMAIGFKDAVVLHQKSAGHCSLAAVSLCTAKAIRDYFSNGVLPLPGTECNIESRFFGEALTHYITAKDMELWQAMEDIGHTLQVPMAMS